MKTWILALRRLWASGLRVQLPLTAVLTVGAFFLAWAKPAGAFAMLAVGIWKKEDIRRREAS